MSSEPLACTLRAACAQLRPTSPLHNGEQTKAKQFIDEREREKETKRKQKTKREREKETKRETKRDKGRERERGREN